MKIGIEEIKNLLKEIAWFERKEIRDEGALNQEDIRWLRGWTLAPIGIASIFYLASPRRRLYDIFTVYVVTYVFGEIYDPLLSPLLVNDSATNIIDKYPLGIFTALAFFILVGLPFVIAAFYNFYFSLRHGRRLSWNRGSWITVEDLKKADKRWIYFNTVPSLVLTAVLLSAIYFVL